AQGKSLTLHHIPSGKKIELADVADYTFDEKGTVLVYGVSTKDGSGDGLFRLDLTSGQKAPIMTGLANYRNITVHKTTGAVAFLSDKDNYTAEQPSHGL